VLFITGLCAAGYLLGGSQVKTRGVLGLGTAARNVGAALVPASQNFSDPRITVMLVPALWLSCSCSSLPLLGCVSACRWRQTGELLSKNRTNLSSHGRSTGANIGVLAEVSRLEIRASSLDLLRLLAFPRRGYRPSREPGEPSCWRNECVLERTSRWLEERSRRALPMDRSRCYVFRDRLGRRN
jgi:hypothetical protein